MEFKKIVEIFKGEGYKKDIIFNDNEIKEVEKFQGGEYHFLVKENKNWRLGYVTMERAPKEITLDEYDLFKNASNMFFLKIIHSHFLSKLSEMRLESAIYNLYKDGKLEIDDIFNALKQFNIPEKYMSFKKVNNHSIKIFEEKRGWVTEYIDIAGSSHGRTIPVDKSENLFMAFSKIVYLYLLDNIIIKYLDGKKSSDYFTAKEIVSYI